MEDFDRVAPPDSLRAHEDRGHAADPDQFVQPPGIADGGADSLFPKASVVHDERVDMTVDTQSGQAATDFQAHRSRVHGPSFLVWMALHVRLPSEKIWLE